MGAKRHLIVNADDLGQSHGVNRGIFEAHEKGIVTSASLMVRWPAAADAVRRCRDLSSLSLGIHLDLGEWLYRGGEWVARYRVVDLADAVAVAAEIDNQIDRFLDIVGSPPSHVDSHQHVHLKPSVRAAAMAVAERLDIPLRHLRTDAQYCGDFYGQDTEGNALHERIGLEALIRTLRNLPPGRTELACHPGYAAGLASTYSVERKVEVRTLCDPTLRRILAEEGIELCSFDRAQIRGDSSLRSRGSTEGGVCPT